MSKQEEHVSDFPFSFSALNSPVREKKARRETFHFKNSTSSPQNNTSIDVFRTFEELPHLEETACVTII